MSFELPESNIVADAMPEATHSFSKELMKILPHISVRRQGLNTKVRDLFLYTTDPQTRVPFPDLQAKGSASHHQS